MDARVQPRLDHSGASVRCAHCQSHFSHSNHVGE